MGMKSVEMQIAIPRTMDAGKIQEQLQQRGQNLVDHANQAVQKDVERKKYGVAKNEQAIKSNLLKEREKKGPGNKKKNNKPKEDEDQRKRLHPYKGTIIDYSG